MTDPGLLAAVLAEPESDLPRLVYADWLEENGQGERSEFIRLQLKLAKVPEFPLFPAFVGAPRVYQRPQADFFWADRLQESLPPSTYLEGDVRTAELPAEFREPPPVPTPLGTMLTLPTFLFRIEARDPIDGKSYHFPKARLLEAHPRGNGRISSVRLQLPPLAPDEMEAKTLRRRERELLEAHGADWFRADRGMVPGAPVERNAWHYRPLPSMHPYRYWLGYRRGFLGHFDGPAADWLDVADILVKHYPVREVTLTTWPESEGGQTHATGAWRFRGRLRWHPFGFATTEEALAAEWPGVKFTLPPPSSHVVSGPVDLYFDGNFLGTAVVTEPCAESAEEHAILHGNPAAGKPQGVIQAKPKRKRKKR